MPLIHPPRSSVAGRRIPLTLAIEIESIESAPDSDVTIHVQFRPVDPTLSRLVGQTTIRPAQPHFQLAIPVDSIAAGDYVADVTVRYGTTVASSSFGFYRVPDEPGERFPFGIYAIPFPKGDMDACRAMLREVKATGLDLICQHMDMIGDLEPIMDEAVRMGFRFMPSTNFSVDPKTADHDLLDRMVLPDGTEMPGNRKGCFSSAQSRRKAAADLDERLRDYATHAGFSGLVYYGDDLFLRAGNAEAGQVTLTCYCDRCLAEFRARTGLEAPAAAPRVRGIVANDHPWLLWMRHRCGWTYGGFVQGLEDQRRKTAPDVKMGLVHGFPFAPFTHIRCGIYGPLTQPTSVVSSYAYPYLRSPRAYLLGHFELGRMGNRGKDVWMLGAVNSNGTHYPSWQVYQNFWTMLAAGYRFIGFFGWHDFVMSQNEGRYLDEVEACKRALQVVGAAKDWLLPVAGQWTPTPAKYAALYSFTTEAFDLSPDNRGHEHLERVLEFHRRATRENVSMELICEEEVLSGWLDRYEAVCLRDVRVLPQNVKDALDTYVRRGGVVFSDNDILVDYGSNHPMVWVEDEVRTSPETMIALLRDMRPPDVTVDHRHVMLRTLQSGVVDYLVLVNQFTDQYWGFTFRYWDKVLHKNFEDIKRVRDEAVEARLGFAKPGHWLSDLSTGELLGSTDSPLKFSLNPSWGRVIAVLPCPEVSLHVMVTGIVNAGESAACHIAATSPTGEVVDGAFAVRLQVARSDGSPSAFGGMICLKGGRASIDIPIGVNEPIGQWFVRVEGGFPRRVITSGFEVTAAKKSIIELQHNPI